MKNVKEVVIEVKGKDWENALDKAFNKKKKILKLMVLERVLLQKKYL